MQSYLEAVHSQ